MEAELKSLVKLLTGIEVRNDKRIVADGRSVVWLKIESARSGRISSIDRGASHRSASRQGCGRMSSRKSRINRRFRRARGLTLFLGAQLVEPPSSSGDPAPGSDSEERVLAHLKPRHAPGGDCVGAWDTCKVEPPAYLAIIERGRPNGPIDRLPPRGSVEMRAFEPQFGAQADVHAPRWLSYLLHG